MSFSFSSAESQIAISGPVGNLQAIITEPITLHSPPIIGIICHPHPLYGGTMRNKVVTTIAKAYSELGLYTIRFNFRGIGQSEGSYANGIGETEDLLAVVDWAKQLLPQASVYLAGFSFGSYIVARASNLRSIKHMIWIAPPVGNFDFSLFTLATCPCLLVQGEADEVVSTSQVYAWAKTLLIQPEIISIPGASHFFHGRLIELQVRLVAALKKFL